MSLKLKNENALKKYIIAQSIKIEKALIYYLEYYVAELVNHAKENASYQDRTANLKSSIGGAVLKDGKPITFRGFEGVQDGQSEGKKFLDSIIKKFSKGYALVIVAGMEYATYVENIHNLNVLKKTELKMESEISGIMQKLKQSIDRL